MNARPVCRGCVGTGKVPFAPIALDHSRMAVAVVTKQDLHGGETMAATSEFAWELPKTDWTIFCL